MRFLVLLCYQQIRKHPSFYHLALSHLQIPAAGMIIMIENGKEASASIQDRKSVTIKPEKNAER
jgi:hypothetical protein